ncbi:3-isopropylmalate dehydrogenase, partial [Acidithiobacillus sp. MC2.1]
MKKIAIFAGDGIGPEIVAAARQVLDAVDQAARLGLHCSEGLVG